MKKVIFSVILSLVLLEGGAFALEKEPVVELSRTVSEKTSLVLGKQVEKKLEAIIKQIISPYENAVSVPLDSTIKIDKLSDCSSMNSR